jgi:hypothetical protein
LHRGVAAFADRIRVPSGHAAAIHDEVSIALHLQRAAGGITNEALPGKQVLAIRQEVFGFLSLGSPGQR